MSATKVDKAFAMIRANMPPLVVEIVSSNDFDPRGLSGYISHLTSIGENLLPVHEVTILGRLAYQAEWELNQDDIHVDSFEWLTLHNNERIVRLGTELANI